MQRIKIVAVLFLLVIVVAVGGRPVVTNAEDQPTAYGPQPAATDPYAGIADARVLPLLKHLPYDHGGWNVPAIDGRLLYDLIVANGYKRGLEIGTSNGYSTLWLGLAFRETGGQIVTIEIDTARAQEAQDNFRKAGLDDVIELQIADAFKAVPALEGEFDFVFLDAWKPDYPAFLVLLRDRLSVGGALTAHNVSSHGREMSEFLETIENDPGLETTIDRASAAGVSISIVREKKGAFQ
jgi:predicted O-methyltransferase YrrM